MKLKNKVKKTFFLGCCLWGIGANAQNFTIIGTVYSKENGETLISASAKVLNSNYGTSSNEYGFYSISLPKSKYKIVYSAVGRITIKRGVINIDRYGENKVYNN